MGVSTGRETLKQTTLMMKATTSTSGRAMLQQQQRPCLLAGARSRAVVRVRAAMDPVHTVAAAEGLRAALEPTAASFRELNLPEALIKWGHPGNMAVVLGAMGGYGALYLGWQIRLGTDEDAIVKAKDLHPKLSAGMFIFFALGAVGGILSLIMQNKPIFESTHVVTGLGGLGLLSFQAMLPLFFQDDPSTRTAHAYLGTAIFALFVVHAFLGLQLGLGL